MIINDVTEVLHCKQLLFTDDVKHYMKIMTVKDFSQHKIKSEYKYVNAIAFHFQSQIKLLRI